MYDNMVKRLNAYSAEHENHGGITAEAADAIEELQKQVLEWQKSRDLERSLCAALEQQIPRWIPVTERLPEHGWYLAYGPTIKMEVLHFHSVEGVWSSERYYNIEVTHWMPLPEPPKEEA